MFKVGEQVQIRPDLKRKQEYFGITHEMERMAGLIVTIKKVHLDESAELKEDRYGFTWHHSWLLPMKTNSTAVKMFIEE